MWFESHHYNRPGKHKLVQPSDLKGDDFDIVDSDTQTPAPVDGQAYIPATVEGVSVGIRVKPNEDGQADDVPKFTLGEPKTKKIHAR